MRFVLTLIAVLAVGVGDAASQGGKAPTPIVRNQYELRTLSYADTFVLLRFERFSGRTWIYSMLRWQEIEEPGRTSVGNFDILLVPVGNVVSPLGVTVSSKDYRVFRIDRDTGITWTLIATRWEEVKER